MSSPLTKIGPAIAASALAVPHSRIRELAEIAMSMDGVLKLYFGESNLPTPEFIKRAAQKAMADGYTFYTENAGLPSLRKGLARYYEELHGIELDASTEFVVTASGVQALNLAIRCILDPGDEALVLTPAWPNGAANAYSQAENGRIDAELKKRTLEARTRHEEADAERAEAEAGVARFREIQARIELVQQLNAIGVKVTLDPKALGAMHLHIEPSPSPPSLESGELLDEDEETIMEADVTEIVAQ